MKPVEISYSRVQTYERCPWMYHLVYDEGWRAGPKAPAALGQSLHQTLDGYLEPSNTDRTLERLFELYDQVWVNEGFGTPQETIEAYERGKAMLQHFFEIDRTRKSTVIATEKEFDVEIEPGVHFKGTIDRLDQHPDGSYEVIEYKTGRETWSPARVDADRQMTFYALGLSHTLGNSAIKLSYYFLSSGTAAETKRTAVQLQEATQLILNTASQIRAGNFTPNHASCARCEFGKRCVNYKPL